MPTSEELLLSLGLKIKVTLLNNPYTLELRGWSENDYIIVDAPDTIGLKVTPGTSCQVQFVRDGVVVTFKSLMEYMHVRDKSFMLLKFPENYEKIKMRKSDRTKVRIPATYSQSISGNIFERDGVVADLSTNGVLMSHADSLRKGDTINIILTLPDGVTDNIEANVCNVRNNPKNPKAPFVSGIKFLNLTSAHINRIENYILSLKQQA
jgi:c-di-GMP-binding flagellar brake protein YcgR